MFTIFAPFIPVDILLEVFNLPSFFSSIAPLLLPSVNSVLLSFSDAVCILFDFIILTLLLPLLVCISLYCFTFVDISFSFLLAISFASIELSTPVSILEVSTSLSVI